jgi:hypothetical protein
MFMYSLAQLATAVKQPHFVFTELNRLWHSRLWRIPYNPDGIDVFAEDWDTLVVLDACRFDVFAEAVAGREWAGSLESRQSRGSATREWIRGNFSGRTVNDTVYLDSNGYYGRLKDEIGAEVFKYILIENDEFGGISVHPDKVTDAALDTVERFPDKRLIVHYMQPHQPFFGPSAAGIDHAPGFEETVRQNDLDDDTIRRCYRENVDLVLESVRRLLEGLDGRTVVSADHGELLGDSQSPLPVGYYGHPAHLHVPELVEVPWLVHESGPRRTITEETPAHDEVGLDRTALEEKLRNLGYTVLSGVQFLAIPRRPGAYSRAASIASRNRSARSVSSA